jgi:protein-disulfide isomerase
MNLQKQVADKQQEKVLELLNQNKAEVERTSGLPFVGAINSDITVLMFGDYTDPKSKAMFKMYQNVIQKDKQFRVIFRFLPDTSALAQKTARVAMAMNEQGLFDKFHDKMMSSTETLTDTALMDIAGNIPGVNRSKLETDIDSAKIKELIANNRVLAEKLGITQTPGYIIGDFLLKQPISPEDLDLVIAKLREKKK